MSRNVIWWIGLCAAAILVAGRGRAAGEPWRAAEQPELKQALEKAPVLSTESLGEPARGVNVWERWMVPNPDGKTWDVLQVYFKEYYGPTWLFAFDLGTGQVKRQRLPDNHQFYLSGRALGLDGKYYIATPSRRTWNMHMFVYDPATNTLEERGEIVPGLGGEVRPLVVGPDGRIYGTGTRGNRVGLYIYDPRLRKVVKDFGPVGPSHPNGAWSRYVMGVDDTHAYIASGMIPAWYLVAVNLQTGEEKVLLESPTERVMDIVESFPGAWAIVPQEQAAPRKEYWLYHGQAIPKTGDTPPWPPKASPWDKGAKTKPQVYFDQIDPDADGNATLWYRTAEDAARRESKERARRDDAAKATPEDRGWKAIRVAGRRNLSPPDQSLVAPARRPAVRHGRRLRRLVHFRSPRPARPSICGPRVGLGTLHAASFAAASSIQRLLRRASSSSTIPRGLGRWARAGLPAIRRLTRRRGEQPRSWGTSDKTTRVAIMHSSALGADGKIYFGGFGIAPLHRRRLRLV